MDIKRLKEYILTNDKIEYILSAIGCKYIVKHDRFYTCSNYDGDNKNAICQYFDSDHLTCINYTRDIRYGKANKSIDSHSTSLIDLVCFNKKLNLFQCAKYLCDILGLDYYHMENEEDVPESLKILQMLYDMKSGNYLEEDIKIKPINEHVLSYYKPYVNDMFASDGIPYEIQKEFEIGYDDVFNHITIPIRDELGNLVGVKGRVFEYGDIENKYIALERYPKSKVLYGLYKSLDYIKKSGKCYVVESEKSVMKLYAMGIYNCVSIGGHKMSRTQANKLISLGVDIVLCFDKDIEYDKEVEGRSCLKNECKNLKDMGAGKVYYMYDKDDLLLEKQAPCDDEEVFKVLLEKNVCEFKDDV